MKLRLTLQIHKSLTTDRIGYQFASSPLELLAYIPRVTGMLSIATTRKEVATHVEPMNHKYTILEYRPIFIITSNKAFTTFEPHVSSLVLLVTPLPPYRQFSGWPYVVLCSRSAED